MNGIFFWIPWQLWYEEKKHDDEGRKPQHIAIFPWKSKSQRN